MFLRGADTPMHTMCPLDNGPTLAEGQSNSNLKNSTLTHYQNNHRTKTFHDKENLGHRDIFRTLSNVQLSIFPKKLHRRCLQDRFWHLANGARVYSPDESIFFYETLKIHFHKKHKNLTFSITHILLYYFLLSSKKKQEMTERGKLITNTIIALLNEHVYILKDN